MAGYYIQDGVIMYSGFASAFNHLTNLTNPTIREMYASQFTELDPKLDPTTMSIERVLTHLTLNGEIIKDYFQPAAVLPKHVLKFNKHALTTTGTQTSKS